MAELRAGEANGRLLARDSWMLNVEVHAQAAVPDRAIATAVQSVGWERLTPVLYAVMTARLRADSGFDDYRDQLLDECAAQKPEICSALKAGFELVGIDGSAPAVTVASAPAAPAVTAGVR
jgi:Zn-dependent metalloprotease